MTAVQIRQGDIILKRVASAPASYKHIPAKRAIVGYGEATGHTHVLADVEWVVAPETSEDDLKQFALGRKMMPVFTVVPEATTLTHQEHATLVVPPGVWQVARQAEYTPQAIRTVID